MSVFSKNLNLWRRTARLATLVMTFTASVFVAGAQTPPYALFQYSNLTGSGNTITAAQIPVVTASGVTVYVNLAMQFDVDANGNLTISAGYPQVTQAPTPTILSFMSGRYVGPSTILGGQAIVTVNGPGVTDGGATEWSLSSATGAAGCTYPNTATWYVGPIASNPYAARLKSAGITTTAWSYGVGSSQCSTDASWGVNTLMGMSQVGNALTIVSFTRNGSDSSTPVDQITYTLAP